MSEKCGFSAMSILKTYVRAGLSKHEKFVKFVQGHFKACIPTASPTSSIFFIFIGLEEFLMSVVLEEVSNLPRGVAHSKIKSVETSENKLMASIPELLKRQYDKCKQPSLKSFIAGMEDSLLGQNIAQPVHFSEKQSIAS